MDIEPFAWYFVKQSGTSHNRTVYASPPNGRLGLRKTAVGAMRLCAVFLRHILTALEMLRISFSGPPKRHIQPERYVQYFMPKFVVAGAIRGT
jgi:hypothetical protein